MTDTAAEFIPTRRTQRRAETFADIKTAALAQLRREGAASLSLRAVARDLGMSGPGLYRYYARREDLLTALVADAYDDLAGHLEAARDTVGPEVTERLVAVSRAYRDWATAHPAEFGLLFDAPLPGYSAPPGGPTVTAVTRYSSVFVDLIAEGWEQARENREGRPASRDPSDTVTAEPLMPPQGQPDPALTAVTYGFWARLHGLTTLSVYGHLSQAGVTDTAIDALYDRELRELLTELGLTP